VTLCILPLYHIYALNVTMGPLLFSGGKLVCIHKFDHKKFINALEKYRVRQ
jgi:acyl-CoA synthetase (AMP-forming)/AMP-acid ligase II